MLQEGTFQEGWKIWEGIECEGKHKGLHTLFIGPDCTMKELGQVDLSKYEQVYLNPGPFQDSLDWFGKLNEYEGIVTIAVFVVDYPFFVKSFPQATFMVIIRSHPLLSSVRDEDVIRIDIGDMRTYSFCKSDVIKTDKSLYVKDKKIW